MAWFDVTSKEKEEKKLYYHDREKDRWRFLFWPLFFSQMMKINRKKLAPSATEKMPTFLSLASMQFPKPNGAIFSYLRVTSIGSSLLNMMHQNCPETCHQTVDVKPLFRRQSSLQFRISKLTFLKKYQLVIQNYLITIISVSTAFRETWLQWLLGSISIHFTKADAFY